MRADRLLSALLLLQAHGRLSGRELSKRLEVSERTVHRDMEALIAAGIPVFARRGSRGGWQLREDWRTQLLALDEAEFRALLMIEPRATGTARVAAAGGSPLGKLMAALPESIREKAAAIQQRLYVDTAGWRGTAENLSMLPTVQNAVSRDRKLALRYWRAGQELVERIVDPLGLVAKGSAWYLVAGTPSGLRTYRVSRIEQATLLDEQCERPADFDLAAFWKSSTERFLENWPRYYATLRMEPRAATWMKMWRATEPVPDAEGPNGEWITLRVQFEHEEEACFVALALGPRVNVIHPESLRERLAADGGMFGCLDDTGENSFKLLSFEEVIRRVEVQHRAIAAKQESERRAAQELEIAKEVQGRLFPQTLPPLQTLEYAGVCIQAREVGGDYYDFLSLGRERLGLVIGDIAGKGIAAALLMANLQANLRSQFALAVDQPERFLESVNRLFYQNTADSAYATLFFAEYDDTTRLLRYANCGHLSALLLRRDGTLERLDSTCPVLGLFPEWECSMEERRLLPDDVLVLYTDGVTESFNGTREEFGESRLVESLRLYRELCPEALLQSVVQEVRRFSPDEQHDDITLIVAKGR